MSDPFANLQMESALRVMASNPALALEIGRASEHLVVADLIMQGYRAFLTDQGLPYDVIVDDGGHLVRVQVKAACFVRNTAASKRRSRMAYSWSVRRRGKNGKADRLSKDHCDIVALVALDARRVAYVPVTACSETVSLPLHSEPGRFGYTIEELESFSRALAGHPRALGTNGRKAAIRRNGQLTLVAGGLDV